MKRKVFVIFILALFFVTGCSVSREYIALQIDATRMSSTLSVMQTSAAVHKVIPSATPWIIIVTQTPSSTPRYTATITLTPSETPLPTDTPIPSETPLPSPTTDVLTMPKTDGNYLVNVDIAPGVWRSDGQQEDCYWKLTTKTDDIIKNYLGLAGGTMYVSPSAFAVHLDGCGTWTYYAKP